MPKHFFKLNTISKRLFLSLGILIASIIVVSTLALIFQSKIRSIHAIEQAISGERILIVRLIKTDLDFLRIEIHNNDFFKTRESQLLKERNILAQTVKEQMRTLRNSMIDNDFRIDHEFEIIDSLLTEYNKTFQQLTDRILVRGFKDFGLEGEMRFQAHELEKQQDIISMVNLLMLRRHEKDFMLRKEEHYLVQFNKLANSLIINLTNKNKNTTLLEHYQEAFNSLASIDKEIGYDSSRGLLGLLNKQTTSISAKLDELIKLSNYRTQEIVNNSGIVFLSIGLSTILISLSIVYYTASRLAVPLKKLSGSMNKFILHEGLNEKEFNLDYETDEISRLAQSFITMSRKLRVQFSDIEHKTQLLEKQNDELKKLNEELDRFIYSAAHDLKSPLASLSGLVNLAKIEINTKSHNHYFDMMSASIIKLDSFIKDITDYAKNKRQHLNVQEVDFAKVVEDILQSLDHLPQASRIQSFIRVSGTKFNCDRMRLEIILKNLISNSYRYYAPNKQNNYLFIEANIHDDQVSIEIMDNGIGIGRSHLPRIFDMFYRAVDNAHGSGIGLFLVKETVKMLHGKITVKSSLKNWTRFTITLPNNYENHSIEPETDKIEITEKNIVLEKSMLNS
jgi:signal transduction histidine kinase